MGCHWPAYHGGLTSETGGFHLGVAASYRHGEYDRIAPPPGLYDATGWGGYGQVGWLFGHKRRRYEPKWATWKPIQAGKEQIFEVFARISVTGGNDDRNSSNELGLLTLGGNWYYRKFRVSANILLAETERSVFAEDNGNAVSLRLQYLF